MPSAQNRSMDNIYDASHILGRLEGFRRNDAERDEMVAELIDNFEDLKAKYEEKCFDYDSEVKNRRALQREVYAQEQQLGQHKQSMNSNSFVFAIVDGDGAIFDGKLLGDGHKGGEIAAQLLLRSIRQHLEKVYPEANSADWNVMIHIVLNADGLSRKLASCGILKSPAELSGFLQAFSLAQPYFTFLDVGPGKELADNKVREMLRFMVGLPQCKHIYLAPCHDTGYEGFLKQYKHDDAVRERLTLVETTPAHPVFEELGFEIHQFPKVFRSEPLPDRLGAAPLPTRTASVPAMTAPPPKSNTPPVASASPSASWAAMSRSNGAGGTIDITPKKASMRGRSIMVNRKEERVDPKLQQFDPNSNKRVNDRIKAYGMNLCNYYHITGKCDNEYCEYQHEERASPGEQLVLRHKALSLVCTHSGYCRSFDCLSGHHCKSRDACTFGSSKCHFAENHIKGFDYTPYKRIYEDGTQEFVA